MERLGTASFSSHFSVWAEMALPRTLCQKSSILTVSPNIFTPSLTNEDGVGSGGGSAGSGDCCDWDSEPADHTSTDRCFGTGNRWCTALQQQLSKLKWYHNYFWILGIHGDRPCLSNRSHSNTCAAPKRTDGSGPWGHSGCTALCHPVPTGPGCAGDTHKHIRNQKNACRQRSTVLFSVLHVSLLLFFPDLHSSRKWGFTGVSW